MAEQVGKFLTELPELETPTDGDLMYIVDAEASANSASKKITMSNLKRVLGGNVTGTVEGASVSFSDGADGIPMEECEVTIVPTQDLHGYSKPWAGGAGKNKMPNNVTSGVLNNVTFTVDSEGITTLSGTATAEAVKVGTFTLAAGSYIYTSEDNETFSTYDTYISIRATGVTIARGMSGYEEFTLTEPTELNLGIRVRNGVNVDGVVIKPMIRESTAPSGFEPYSNICPISGNSSVTVTVASTSGGSGEDYTVSLGATYYGGNLDVTTGELEVTWGNIASYAGESLPGEWLSSLDEYSALGTPTTGAQVVYELATPQTFNLTPTQVLTLLGQNYVRHDGGGNIKVVYIRDLDIVINDLIDRVTALENE